MYEKDSHKKHNKLLFEENKAFLSSKKDWDLFFQAILNPQEPNEKLKKASHRYNKLIKS